MEYVAGLAVWAVLIYLWGKQPKETRWVMRPWRRRRRGR